MLLLYVKYLCWSKLNTQYILPLGHLYTYSFHRLDSKTHSKIVSSLRDLISRSYDSAAENVPLLLCTKHRSRCTCRKVQIFANKTCSRSERMLNLENEEHDPCTLSLTVNLMLLQSLMFLLVAKAICRPFKRCAILVQCNKKKIVMVLSTLFCDKICLSKQLRFDFDMQPRY